MFYTLMVFWIFYNADRTSAVTVDGNLADINFQFAQNCLQPDGFLDPSEAA